MKVILYQIGKIFLKNSLAFYEKNYIITSFNFPNVYTDQTKLNNIKLKLSNIFPISVNLIIIEYIFLKNIFLRKLNKLHTKL